MASSAGTCASACAERTGIEVLPVRRARPSRERPGRGGRRRGLRLPPRGREPARRRRPSSIAGNVGFTGRCLRRILADAGPADPVRRSRRRRRPSARQSVRRAASARPRTVARDCGRAPAAPVCDLPAAERLRQVGRPNYNSAVATFCHNVVARPADRRSTTRTRQLSWSTSTTSSHEFLRLLDGDRAGRRRSPTSSPSTSTTVGEVADTHPGLPRDSRDTLVHRARRRRPRARAVRHVSQLPAARAVRLSGRRSTATRAASSSRC